MLLKVELTKEQQVELDVARRGEPTGIICYSRCLWCGRRTPHEVCHAHSSALGFNPLPGTTDHEQLWVDGFVMEPEVCEDAACPLND